MISDFLIKCSGADTDILKQCPKFETIKFVGIGATIFLTAILAGISGGYAIYFTFNNYVVSFLFGILWGILIFNLDRYIVSSIRKQGNIRKEIYSSIPRILIAIILAVTISKPLELKLFDGSISKKLIEEEDQYNSQCEIGILTRLNDLNTKKKEFQQEISTVRNTIFSTDGISKQIDDRISNLNVQINNSLSIISRNDLIIKNNIVYKDKIMSDGKVDRVKSYNKTAIDKMSNNIELNNIINSYSINIDHLNDSLSKRREELSSQIKTCEGQYLSQIASIQSQINELNTNRISIIEKCKHDSSLGKDLIGRLKALDKIKNKDWIVYMCGLLISILFILIESSPIIVKLLSKIGSYDKILDRMEKELFLQQDMILSDKNEEFERHVESYKELNRTRFDLRTKSEKYKSESELKSVQYCHDEIFKKQMMISKFEVDKWYKAECERLGIDIKNKMISLIVDSLKTNKTKFPAIKKLIKEKSSPKTNSRKTNRKIGKNKTK